MLWVHFAFLFAACSIARATFHPYLLPRIYGKRERERERGSSSLEEISTIEAFHLHFIAFVTSQASPSLAQHCICLRDRTSRFDAIAKTKKKEEGGRKRRKRRKRKRRMKEKAKVEIAEWSAGLLNIAFSLCYFCLSGMSNQCSRSARVHSCVHCTQLFRFFSFPLLSVCSSCSVPVSYETVSCSSRSSYSPPPPSSSSSSPSRSSNSPPRVLGIFLSEVQGKSSSRAAVSSSFTSSPFLSSFFFCFFHPQADSC